MVLQALKWCVHFTWLPDTGELAKWIHPISNSVNGLVPNRRQAIMHLCITSARPQLSPDCWWEPQGNNFMVLRTLIVFILHGYQRQWVICKNENIWPPVQVIAWCQTIDKSWLKPMMTQFSYASSILKDLTKLIMKSVIFSVRQCVSKLCCSAPSHYMTQCWLIVSWTLGNKFQ